MTRTQISSRWRNVFLVVAGFLALAAVEEPAALVRTEGRAVLARIEQAKAVVAELERDVRPTGDDFVLKCLAEKRRRLDAMAATVRGLTGAVGSASAEEAAKALATLRELPAEVQATEEAARACLQIQSGEIVRFGAEPPEAAPEELPEVAGAEPGPIPEPEPVDRPLSPTEAP